MSVFPDWDCCLQEIQQVSEGKASTLTSGAAPAADPTRFEPSPTDSGTIQALDLAFRDSLKATPADTRDIVKLCLLTGHAKALDLAGDWNRALRFLDEALSLAHDLNETSACAEIWRQIGGIRRKQGLWDKARSAHEHSLSICMALNNASGIAAGYNCIGAVYMEEGALNRAQRQFVKALVCLEGSTDHRTRGQILNNLGIIANMRGQWDEAIGHYQKAIACYDRINDQPGLARACQNLGMTYADREDWPWAGEYFEKSLAIARTLGDRHQKALVYLNKIEIYIHFGDLELALVYCRKCIQLLAVSADLRGMAELCKLLGVIFRKQRDWKMARKYFQQALRLTRKFRIHLTRGETLVEQSRMYADRSRLSAAVKTLDEAITCLRKAQARGEVQKARKQLSQYRKLLRR